MKLAVLLVTCKNEPRVTSLTRTWVSLLMQSITPYLSDQSGRRAGFQFRVFDWFELNMTGKEWNDMGFNVGPHVVAARSQALREPLADYDHFALVIDKADARFGAIAPTKPYAHIGAQHLDHALMAHELGHFYGAGHANLLSPSGFAEYGDTYCIMGGEGRKYTFINQTLRTNDIAGNPTLRHSTSGPGMTAPVLLACGWLQLDGHAANLSNALRRPDGQVQVELAPLSGAPTSNRTARPVFAWADGIASRQRLTIEYRRPAGWDRGIPAADGASGWVIAHAFAVPEHPRRPAVQVAAIPTTPGTVAYSEVGGIRLGIIADDRSRGSVTVRVDRQWRPLSRRTPSVASWGRDRLDIFGVGTDKAMYHKAWGPGWYPSGDVWEKLHGAIAGAPSVVSWGRGRLDIFGLGDDGGLWHKAWNGSWHPGREGWAKLGGEFVSSPTAAGWGPNRLDIVGLGTDKAMYHKAWESGWSDWNHLGGSFLYQPAAVSWAFHRLDIFGIGASNAMYHKALQRDQWSPAGTGWRPLGGRFVSTPAVAAWGPQRLDIFGIGTDDAMYHKAWDGTRWYPSETGWEPLGGKLRGTPCAVSWGPNRLDIFALGTDRGMYHKAWAGGWYPSETGWEPLGGKFNSSPAAASWGPNRLDVFGLGTNNVMFHKAWDGRNWYPSPLGWEDIGGKFL